MCKRGPSRRVQQESCDTPPSSVAEALGRLDEWYKSGIPAFTRKSIQDISEQFQCRPIHGQKIWTKGLDGVTVEWDVLIGEISDRCQGDWEHVVQSLSITYYTIAHLHNLLQRGYIDLQHAFCSLQIDHRISKRRENTKELVSPDPVRSYQDANDIFETSIHSWEESAMCKQLKAALALATSHTITKVIALACGSVSSGDKLFLTIRSAFQHALLLTVRNWLIEGKQCKVGCYAQEPEYTRLDKTILEEHNIEVIEDPQAWLEVDDSSIVFACSPNIPVKEIVADLTRPAILIVDRVEETERGYEGILSTDPDSPRVRAMIQHYDQYEFGPDPEHFSGIVIYIRKTPN